MNAIERLKHKLIEKRRRTKKRKCINELISLTRELHKSSDTINAPKTLKSIIDEFDFFQGFIIIY